MNEIIKVYNVGFFFRLINKNFWRNFYILLILLIYPLLIAGVNLSRNFNIIFINQSITAIFTMNIFFISFIIIPMIYYIFSKSSIILMNKNDYRLRRNLLSAIYIFYFLVFLVSIAYTLVIITIWSAIVKEGNAAVYYASNNKQVLSYLEFSFANSTFNCPKLGISNYHSPSWGLLSTVFIVMFASWSFIGLSIGFYIKFINNFILILAVIYIISAATSGLIFNISILMQFDNQLIGCYFSITFYPMLFAYAFSSWSGKLSDSLTIYSIVDNDYSTVLYDTTKLVIFLVVVIIAFLIGLALVLMNVVFDYRKKKEHRTKPYVKMEDGKCSIKVNFKFYFNRINKTIILKENDQRNLVFKNYKLMNKLVFYLKKKYSIDYFSQDYNRLKSAVYLLEDTINYSTEITINNIQKILSLQRFNLTKNIEFIRIYNLLKSVSYNMKQKKNNIDDYLIKLTYLLNSGISGLIIIGSWFMNNEFINQVKEIAKQKEMSVLFMFYNTKTRKVNDEINTENITTSK